MLWTLFTRQSTLGRPGKPGRLSLCVDAAGARQKGMSAMGQKRKSRRPWRRSALCGDRLNRQSKAAIRARISDVSFTPKSRHAEHRQRPLGATSRHRNFDSDNLSAAPLPLALH